MTVKQKERKEYELKRKVVHNKFSCKKLWIKTTMWESKTKWEFATEEVQKKQE